MNGLIMWEIDYVGKCLLFGAGLMCLYDTLRITRNIVLHSIFMIAIEDILYWVVSGVLMFVFLYKYDEGSIRLFAVAVTAIGMIVYNFLISRYAVPLIAKCIKWPIMLVVKTVRWVTSKLRASGKLVTGLLKKYLKKVRMKNMRESVSKKVD